MLIHFEQSNYDVIINNYEMILEAHENDFGTKRTPRRAPSPAPLSPGAIPRPRPGSDFTYTEIADEDRLHFIYTEIRRAGRASRGREGYS